jgi:hypothetical protein
LFTLPIVSQYDKFFSWIKEILTHQGRWGLGDSGFLAINSIKDTILMIMKEETIFTIIYLTIFLFLIALTVKPSWRRSLQNGSFVRELFAILVCQTVGILMIIKHPGDSRYLLPVIALSGFALFFLIQISFNFLEVNVKFGKFSLTIAILIIIYSFVLSVHDLSKSYTELNSKKLNSYALLKKLNTKYQNHVIIPYYGSSSPTFALFFGNKWENYKYTEILEKIYGDIFFYNLFSGYFFAWSPSKELFIVDLLFNGEINKILLHGELSLNNRLFCSQSQSVFSEFIIKLSLAEHSSGEGLYRINGCIFKKEEFGKYNGLVVQNIKFIDDGKYVHVNFYNP